MPLNRRDSDERTFVERALDRSDLGEKSLNERVLDERTFDEKDLDEKTLDDRALAGMALDERTLAERDLVERDLVERGLNDRALDERASLQSMKRVLMNILSSPHPIDTQLHAIAKPEPSQFRVESTILISNAASIFSKSRYLQPVAQPVRETA